MISLIEYHGHHYDMDDDRIMIEADPSLFFHNNPSEEPRDNNNNNSNSNNNKDIRRGVLGSLNGNKSQINFIIIVV